MAWHGKIDHMTTHYIMHDYVIQNNSTVQYKVQVRVMSATVQILNILWHAYKCFAKQCNYS